VLHSVLYPLPCHQENGAPTYTHAVVGDALQVVDHQGRLHTPLRRAAVPGRVGYQVHGLGVQEIHLIVLRLEVAGSLYIVVPEDIQALAEYIACGSGHLHERGLQVLVTLAICGLCDHLADVLRQGA
jgi:hypothetical protein